jgi:rSAM/selenodomain-associated transferase 2
MSLSIIVPCLNEQDTILETLGALVPLRERGAEIIVVDGGSTDETVGRSQQWADRILTAPRGRARQMNAGAAVARGEILLFVHADTRLPDAADGVIIDGLHRTRKSWGRFNVRIDGRARLLPLVALLMNVRSRVSGIATGDQAMFVTRSLFEAAGRFPEIPLMEDVTLSQRLKRFGAPLCLRHEVTTSGRRWDTNGVIRTVVLMWWLRLAYALGADPRKLASRYAAHSS